ncbi:uncharacterized protein LY79DRAFT_275279 [Colletotrichum navitas]|uniref:Uncharacterized protein n=1 Tax=Colletotrichum navitas TaxID=681940 RepID=A0AAD8V3P4_9PEZI|nr:uncharacterized protein LY79DRAFT_275279 [Colletotrichum navitas]KAK1585115.1 hypothetical protein LY79DRAFT_275279 [Colletotrichum navitas]
MSSPPCLVFPVTTATTTNFKSSATQQMRAGLLLIYTNIFPDLFLSFCHSPLLLSHTYPALSSMLRLWRSLSGGGSFHPSYYYSLPRLPISDEQNGDARTSIAVASVLSRMAEHRALLHATILISSIHDDIFQPPPPKCLVLTTLVRHVDWPRRCCQQDDARYWIRL